MTNEVIYDTDYEIYYFNCPHCKVMCQVKKSDIRCTIFRHAVYKSNLNFVNPHASEKECEKWLSTGEVYGCAKPFKFDGNKVEICGYI
jgi:hypothetical protein